MAKIGMGDWGMRTPQGPGDTGQPPRAAFVTPGVDEAGKALDHAANVAASEQITEQKRAEAEARADAKQAEREAAAEAKQRAREQKSVAALRSTTDYGNDVADMHDQLRTDLATGKVLPDKVLKDFDDRAGKLKEKYAATVAPDVSEAARVHMDNSYRDTRRKLGVDLENQRRQQMVADFGATREGLQRRALRDPEGAQAAYETIAKSVLKRAGFTDDKVAADIQNFKESSQRTFYLDQLNTASARGGNMQAIKSLQDRIGKDSILDPNAKENLIKSANGVEMHLLQKGEIAQRQRETAVRTALGSLQGVIDANGTVSPALRDTVAKTVRGTPYEAVYQATMTNYDTDLAYRLASPPQKQTMLNELNAHIAKNGVGDVEVIKRRDRLEAFLTKEKAQLKEDGYSYSVRAGVAQPVPLTLSDIISGSPKLTARLNETSKASSFYGQTISPLSSEEAHAVTDELNKLGPNDTENWLKVLRQRVGAAGVVALTKQISPKDPLLAVAANMAASDVTSSNGRRVSSMILQGRALIGNKDVKVHELEPAMREEFNKQLGDAIATPEGRQAAFASANAVFAKLEREDGRSDIKYITSNYKKALQYVTGGVVDYNGGKILPPTYGLSESDTKKIFGAITPAQIEAWGGVAELTNEQAVKYIQQGKLESIGGGRYRVPHGATLLHRKDGQVFELTFPPGR